MGKSLMLSFGKQLLTFVHFRRILKNRQKAEAPQCVFEKSEIRTWVNPQKASVYSIQGTIESHHNASTNRGYSRKHDGGFYST